MLSASNAYLAVRSINSLGAPNVNGSAWTTVVQAGGWYTLTRDSDGLEIAAWKASQVGSDALFAVFGPKSFLDDIAASEPRMMPAIEAWDRRDESSIRSWLRYWPFWRGDFTVRNGNGDPMSITESVRSLVPSGVQIPDPQIEALPWMLTENGSLTEIMSEAIIRVDSITRPSLRKTLAGYNLDSILENEPSRQ